MGDGIGLCSFRAEIGALSRRRARSARPTSRRWENAGGEFEGEERAKLELGGPIPENKKRWA